MNGKRVENHNGDKALRWQPMKEYFLVAIADRDEAVKALRERRQLLDVQITVAGQATDEYLEWLDVRPGEIFCVMVVS